jgi:hypothetical protein
MSYLRVLLNKFIKQYCEVVTRILLQAAANFLIKQAKEVVRRYSYENKQNRMSSISFFPFTNRHLLLFVPKVP